MFELVQIGSTSCFFCFFNNYLLRFRTLPIGIDHYLEGGRLCLHSASAVTLYQSRCKST